MLESLSKLDPELRVTFDDKVSGPISPNVVEVLDLGGRRGRVAHLAYDSWKGKHDEGT